jgi:hypothetical protein
MSREAEARGVYAAGLKRVKDTPMPKGQKFASGTFVRLADKFPNYMSHFPGAGSFALVNYTYAHAYGGSDTDNYSLLVKRKSGEWHSSSWYEEELMVEIKDEELLEKLQNEVNSGY